MARIDSIIESKIFQNVFIWIVLYLVLSASSAENKFVTGLVIVCILAPPVYITNLFILPYFKKNKYLFIFFFIVTVAVFTIVSLGFLKLLLQDQFQPHIFNMIGTVILAMIFGAAMKLARDSFLKKKIEKEMELKLLKGQLNPHFLFNTLNNLYGLSVVKSDKLPPLMLQLSDLLRYSLYETKETFVDLLKEIEYLENYVSLEGIRLEDQVKIEFNKSGDWKNPQYQIAPMLLIVFLENAFKHLDGNEEDGKVLIDIKLDEGVLFFKCVNSFKEGIEKEYSSEAGGIGLINVAKRLELIYPNNHTYKFDKVDSEYIINLSVKIV